VALLAGAGCEVRHVQFFSEGQLLEMDRQAMALLHGEMARVHANWFEQYRARYRPRTARAIRRGQAVTDEELVTYRAGRVVFREQIEMLMQVTGVDLWVTPASAGPAPQGFDQTGWGGMTTAWSYAGLPCVTVPAGLSTNKLPLGLQCVARFGQDELLLNWAKDLLAVFDQRELSEPASLVHAERVHHE
jgi:Asp-tRNA(Asn)/Glu-tRNA(Gln) amidotransferase A subunit family amidase